MIKFRRKNFVAPLALLGSTKVMGALTAGSLGLQMKDGISASEQAEDQARRDKQIAQQLSKIANSAQQHPQAGAQAAQVLQKSGYAATPAIMKFLTA